MNFEQTSYFSNVRINDQKQFHIFGKDFSVKKSKKKNTFLICFFLSFFFSWETNKLDPKLSKTNKNMCSRYINNFWGKKKLNLNILKCVKVNKSFLSLFQVIPSLIPVIILQ